MCLKQTMNNRPRDTTQSFPWARPGLTIPGWHGFHSLFYPAVSQTEHLPHTRAHPQKIKKEKPDLAFAADKGRDGGGGLKATCVHERRRR